MDAAVCVIWSVLVLVNTPSYKASTTASLNYAGDLFVTSRITDPKQPVETDIPRPPSAPQPVSGASDNRDVAAGEIKVILSRTATTSSPAATTSSSTIIQANTRITEPVAVATAATGVARARGSGTTLTKATRGPFDSTPSHIPGTSAAITPGSPIPSSTDLSEIHQNSSQATTTEIPTGYVSLPSTLQDSTTGSASLEKGKQDEASELEVGDEDSPSPSPLDPLLAGLISIFIISTAMLSIMLFLKFRQQGGHPEFHRLQDLPMDDLLEDTPLSRYSY